MGAISFILRHGLPIIAGWALGQWIQDKLDDSRIGQGYPLISRIGVLAVAVVLLILLLVTG